MAIEPIKVTGLKEFTRNLRKIDADLPKVLRLANNDVADLIVSWAKPRVPTKTGAAASTVKAASTRSEVRVKGGSNKAPYYPWLDFGGRVGRKKSVKRSFYSDGRYLYPGLVANRDALTERLAERLLEVCRSAGVEVSP
jgi:hypothetical protein